jgi:hypothetical protein
VLQAINVLAYADIRAIGLGKCNQAVMDFLAAEVGCKGRGWGFPHIAESPGGERVNGHCHTLARVNIK